MSRITEYLLSHKDEMTAFLGKLVAVPSIQSEASEEFPFGPEPAAALGLMLDKCRESGFIVENLCNYAGSADIPGPVPELAILSHLDVVPAGPGWKADPFTMREENGKLIGRGTIDDKGPAVAALFAAKAVKELAIPLKKGVRLIFGTNEENGSADMAYYRSQRELPPMVFTPDGEYPVINVEKGMLRVYFSAPFFGTDISAGHVVNAVPESCTVDDLTFCGRSAHASTPEKGENAITLFLSECQGDHPLISGLRKLFPHGETDGSSCGLGFSDDISGNTTCVLSMLNTINGRLYGAVDIRFPVNRTKCEVSSIICKAIEDAGFTVDSCEGAEPHCTDENSTFVQGLLKTYERVTGDSGRCIAIGGGTYVHEIEGGVAFGAEFPGTDHNMHSAEEFLTVDELLKNAELMAEAIVELCG